MRAVVVVGLLLLGGVAHADIEIRPIRFRDATNNIVGWVDSDGTIRDGNKVAIGKVDVDGTLRDASNNPIGRIESDGTMRDASNKSAGKIESDGTIRNGQNWKIAKISKDGTIRSLVRTREKHNFCKVDGYTPNLRFLVAADFFVVGTVYVQNRDRGP
jgi:hypothetical protein